MYYILLLDWKLLINYSFSACSFGIEVKTSAVNCFTSKKEFKA